MFWYCDIEGEGFEGLFDSREKAYKAIKEFFTSFEEVESVNFIKDYYGYEGKGIENSIIDIITVKSCENGEYHIEHYELVGLKLNTSYIY